MSNHRKNKIQISNLFDNETKDIIKRDLDLVYGNQEEELQETKENIKKNFLFEDGEGEFIMFFS